MPIILNNQSFVNGGTANYNNGNTTSLSSIRFGNTEVWKKETIETGSFTAVGYAEGGGDIQYTHGWYEKSFNIPVGQTFRLNDFYFESNGTPIFSKAEIYANGNLVGSKNSGQDYAWNSGAKPSATGTYTSTQATNTLRLRAAIAINSGIWTGEYSKTFKYSVYIS